MIVGDNQKYLSCLFTLQVTADLQTAAPTNVLHPGAVSWCKEILGEREIGEVKSVDDFINGPHIPKNSGMPYKKLSTNATRRLRPRFTRCKKWHFGFHGILVFSGGGGTGANAQT